MSRALGAHAHRSRAAPVLPPSTLGWGERETLSFEGSHARAGDFAFTGGSLSSENSGQFGFAPAAAAGGGGGGVSQQSQHSGPLPSPTNTEAWIQEDNEDTPEKTSAKASPHVLDGGQPSNFGSLYGGASNVYADTNAVPAQYRREEVGRDRRGWGAQGALLRPHLHPQTSMLTRTLFRTPAGRLGAPPRTPARTVRDGISTRGSVQCRRKLGVCEFRRISRAVPASQKRLRLEISRRAHGAASAKMAAASGAAAAAAAAAAEVSCRSLRTHVDNERSYRRLVDQLEHEHGQPPVFCEEHPHRERFISRLGTPRGFGVGLKKQKTDGGRKRRSKRCQRGGQETGRGIKKEEAPV